MQAIATIPSPELMDSIALEPSGDITNTTVPDIHDIVMAATHEEFSTQSPFESIHPRATGASAGRRPFEELFSDDKATG
jgi:hypothetical protein